MASARDNMIGLSLFLEGNFDRSLVEQCCRMAADYTDSADLIYVDVGANIGTNTVYALRNSSFGGAVCFEPDEVNFENLVQTLRVNQLDEIVRCSCVAIGEKEGSTTLERSTVNFGDHRIALGTDGAFGSTQVKSLDSCFEDTEIYCIGLVSIDVQGYEAHVLSGASRLLVRDIPFVCELTPDELRRQNGFDRFIQISEQFFNWFVDMREPTRVQAIGELRRCAEAIPSGGHTDVFLSKRRSLSDFSESQSGQAHHRD